MKEAVCILIQNDNGHFLGVSRKYDKNDFGLPGGTVEQNETNVQAIIRELKEETGLDVINIQPVFISYDKSNKPNDEMYEVTTYVGDIYGEINTSESGIVKWVTKEQLFSGTFGHYNKALFKHLRLL